MTSIGAFEAKNRLGSLLDRVEKGEEIVITRRGRPVARLVPEEAQDRAAARAAVDRILTRKRSPLRGLKVKDLVEEGRE